MHKELIKKIIEKGTPEDMECLKDIVLGLFDHIKICDRGEYKELEYKLYKIVYGEHLNEELAHKWVAKMENKDGTKGEHWTYEQTSQYADKLNKCDFYVALNMVYSDFYNPKFDLATYIELAKDWLNDKDVDDGKLLKYYMFVV